MLGEERNPYLGFTESWKALYKRRGELLFLGCVLITNGLEEKDI